MTAVERAASGVFDDGQAATLSANDGQHWWFREKARIVADVVDRFAPRTGRLWIDIGAGAGGVSALLGGDEAVVAIEGSAGLASQCRARQLLPIQALVDHLPVAERAAGVLTLLDVIEHLADPVFTLREARRVLRPDGLLVVTVPAHRWLWSAADEALGHVMRYTRRDLRGQLASAGFRTVTCTHVFSWLAPPILLRRRFGNPTSVEGQLGVDTDSRALSAAARVLTSMELKLQRRTSLPLGSSIIAAALPR